MKSRSSPNSSRRRAPASNSSARTEDRSESTEDHLERIDELVEAKGYARVTDIAEALGLSVSTVSNMVRRLAARGFVNYERYRGFTLTPDGRRVAEGIRARHKILTRFLTQLGLSPETVAEEVERIEHHLQPKSLAAFEALVQFWTAHPDQLQTFRNFAARRTPPSPPIPTASP